MGQAPKQPRRAAGGLCHCYAEVFVSERVSYHFVSYRRLDADALKRRTSQGKGGHIGSGRQRMRNRASPLLTPSNARQNHAAPAGP